MRNELFSAGLKMDLKTSIARLHHDVVVRNLEFVQSFNVDREWAASETNNSAIQLAVARNWGQVVQRQIGRLQRRQNSRKQNIRVQVVCGAPRLRDERVQLIFHLSKTIAS